MRSKDKDKEQTSKGASGSDALSPQDAHQANRDLSWERNARNATLAKQVVEVIAREMAKVHVHYQALLNEKGTAAMPTSLQMTSSTLGFKVMDPFDWTKDKARLSSRDGNCGQKKLDMP